MDHAVLFSETTKAAAKRPRPGWPDAAGACIALLVILPVLGLVLQAAHGSAGLWGHLLSTVLPVSLGQTVVLLAGVGIVTAVIGTMTAWLVTAYAFPGRRALEWMLLLPLAMPTYIIAYAYLDILHPIGPVQSAIRDVLGYETPRQFRLPDIRSMTGCILLLGLVLYPYVYIPTRALFLTQSGNLADAARILGTSRRAIFWRVALPLARPAVAVGISLALMETLNDVGAAEFLGVRTLTVSIYTTWITRSDLPGASQLALALLLFVLALMALERWARRKQSYAVDARRSRGIEPRKVSRVKGMLMLVAGAIPVLLGFVAPASYLAVAAWERYRFAGVSTRLADEAINTISLATIATIVTVSAGLVVALALRLRPRYRSSWFLRISTLGYAAPGTVIAIGVLIVLAGADRFVDQTARAWFGAGTGLLLIGSGAAVVYALAVRFLTISAGSMEAGFSRVPASLDQASRSLGQSSTGTFRHVHLPLTKAAIAAGALLVFVDCMKELPATLLLRPLNFETFATHLYGEAARGTYEEASLAALAIVAISILPVVLLARVGARLPTAGESPGS